MIGTREKRFFRYASVGVGTFLFDLLLLFVLVDFLHVYYIVATAGAFFCAVSINYFVSRRFVFKKTDRSLMLGYLYFLQYAVVGMVVTAGLMWMVTEYTAWSVYISRVLIAGIVGMCNYLVNLYRNFRVVGVPLE